MFYNRKSSKYWLWGSIVIIVVNLIFFLLRNHVGQTLLLWVVILTPVACLALYPLTRLLDNDELSRSEKNS